ncbi:ATP-dependent RNA helicase ddx1 [Plakobranchus ocellatus]|uniref:ATP-dependent RNA helicase DDX1 n=1 Tax=Plakobranchus ocellatus TaxID=259542 RepID=A0AAV4DR94_9GAST|nr:ATP-dependent RNA helicase ddx1 [Plakobranchus ocellatus]
MSLCFYFPKWFSNLLLSITVQLIISVSFSLPETYSEAVKILKGEYVIAALEQHKMDVALIFCRTKLDCDNLEKYLQRRGGGKYSCVCLHGDRKPQERKANLEKFKRREVKYLICTDVAARGIDISGLPYVINVTLPDEKQNYIHRIGRVGRAERMGLAISLVASCKEKVWYHSNCNTRGRGCYNTNLTDYGGCCIWYDEPKLLSDVEEHLDITIDRIQSDMKVPINEKSLQRSRGFFGANCIRTGPVGEKSADDIH